MLSIHAHEDSAGDILVFLPGGEEIDRAVEMVISVFYISSMFKKVLIFDLA